MMPPRSHTADSVPTLRDDSSNVGSNMSTPTLMTPHPFDRQWNNPVVTALSPPPSTRSLPRRKSNFRLRSDSGLALHTNQAAFAQYTDYNPDGSTPSRPFRPRNLSVDDSSSLEDFSLRHQISAEPRGLVSNGTVLPDFFEPAVIRRAFSNPTTAQRLCAFAETRHGGADIDFLLKVEEFQRALGDVISSMSYISSHFTGTTATTPLDLPADVASTLKGNIKFSARTAIPALDKVYQEAKAAVEVRLSQNLYPEFLKHQVSQRLTAALTAHHSPTGEITTHYPGLADAFCLTDPLRPDNPLVFASDGLVTMCGYQLKEMIGKNARFFQGLATDPEATMRLSRAVTSGREATELILNYLPDGTPYWNFLFICPLMENGSVRYFLGAQVNISDNSGADYEDILDVLNFGRPPEDLQSPTSPRSSSWSSRQSSDNPPPDQDDDESGDKRTSRRRRFFRRFQRKTPTSRPSSPTRPGSASTSTDDMTTTTTTTHQQPLSPRALPPLSPESLTQQQPLDEHSTPYSRFLVMRFDNSSNTSTTYSSTPTSPASPSPSRPSPETRHHRRRLTRENQHPHHHQPPHHRGPQLPIKFCSSYALSLLGLKQHEAHHLLDRDAFAVLSSRLGSPTVNRAFRGNVLGKLAEGRSVTLDLMAPAISLQATSSSSTAVGGGGGGDGGGLGGGGIAGASVSGGIGGIGAGGGDPVGGGGEARPRVSATLDRGAEFFNQVLFSGGGQARLRRVVSSWVPLKDEEGRVGWVVLVLNPVDDQ